MYQLAMLQERLLCSGVVAYESYTCSYVRCPLLKEFSSKELENTLSAAAEDGCTKSTCLHAPDH